MRVSMHLFAAAERYGDIRCASTLILLRHGESLWNRENRFTGWTDVPLTERGMREADAAGKKLMEAGLQPDSIHSSVLCTVSADSPARPGTGRPYMVKARGKLET